MAELPILTDAFLCLTGEKIAAFGKMEFLPSISAAREIDARGRFVFPSFVDSHTHLIFADSREEEFVMKIRGLTYQDIAAKGGGILNSAKKLQQLSEEELFNGAMMRANEIIRTGTGARSEERRVGNEC